jgi:2-polyprenyl-3-methyl-5-hydroxy-6-metoxy-1,4-benzoquinol methylase
VAVPFPTQEIDMPKTKIAERDARDYDMTQLHENGHGKTLHRDYSSHFFRWSFARRFVKMTDNVLEVGCGQDKPLSKILTGGAAARVNTYVGVDLNKLKPSGSQRLTFHGEFNFVERYKELIKAGPKGGFDVLVTMEVVEHFHSRFMPKFLKGCYDCLKPGGVMLLSTPVYDGVRMASNHINEMTIPILQKHLEKAGFKVRRRYGTFLDIKHIGKTDTDRASKAAILEVRKALGEYFDNDAISNIFGCLYPDHARNNLWVIVRP